MLNRKIIFLLSIILIFILLSSCGKISRTNDVKTNCSYKENTIDMLIEESKVQSQNLQSVDNDNIDKKYDSEKLGFMGGNISAGGLISGDGNGWIYYRSENDNWCLYKAKLDGTQKNKLCDDIPSCINVLGDWVYYSNYKDGFSIYRIKSDGSEREKLVDGYCRNLYVTENGMYFDIRDENNSPQVYHAKLDGTDKNLIVQDMRVAAYYDKSLYCYNTKTLKKYDNVTGELDIIYDGYTHNHYADINGIYFWAVDDNKYYKMDYDGKLTELAKNGDSFNYADGKLYYIALNADSFDNYCMYCLDTKTMEKSIILSLSEQYFDIYTGEALGITIKYFRENYDKIDASLFDHYDGAFIGINEQAGYPYIIEGRVYSRGVLKESKTKNGRWDCIILCNGSGGTVWD